MQELAAHPVDVIVPVYRGLDETRRCIESATGGTCRTPFELVVIDDGSPDTGLREWLREGAAQGRFTLLENETNLGFVATANRGMALHTDRDVVLLNSDTEVANDWLDRLRACAHREPDIGTATPFSNNATICSYPFEGWDGGLPGGLGLARLDRMFADANAGCVVDLPTAVGFCMYIRRACLDEAGLFDERRFGRGYGEENDFCMRAAKRGWRSVLAADVFVFHEGGVSFSDERTALQKASMAALLEAHPDYTRRVREFQERDPAASLREAVDRARVALGVEEALHVLDEQSRRHANLRDRLAGVAAVEEGLARAEMLVRKRDAAITALQAGLDHAAALVGERDAAIKALEAGLAHAEALIGDRDAMIVELQDGLERATALATERGAELDRIQNSWVWKYMNFLMRVRS